MLRAASLAVFGCLAACVSSHQLVGTPRPPVPPDQVQLFTEAPPRPYERIAVVSASSKHSFAFSYQGKAEVVVRRLKEEAGRLGANGVLLDGIGEKSVVTVGTDLGTYHEGPRGTIDVGVGASALLMTRYGSGVAIYVPAE